MRVVSTPQLLSSFFVVPSAKLRKSETSQMFEVSYEILRDITRYYENYEYIRMMSRCFKDFQGSLTLAVNIRRRPMTRLLLLEASALEQQTTNLGSLGTLKMT